MMRSIRKHDDPILKRVCQRAVPGGDATARAAQDLYDTLRARLDAVGLAAPQIGADVRVIAIKPTRDSGVTIMLNPEIVGHSIETTAEKEGCLSYPGVHVEIERFNSVRIQYETIGGAIVREYDGWPARIVQHEIDHLDGICKVGDEWRRLTAKPVMAESGGAA